MRQAAFLIAKTACLSATWRATAGLLLTAALWAAPQTGWSAVKINSCSVTKPSNLVFITNLLTNLSSATTFTISCSTIGNTGTANFTIALSAGTYGTVAQRVMKNGTNSLTYNLYQDVQYTQVWGTTGNQLMMVKLTDDLKNQSYTIYGLIDATPANRAAPAGSYSDTNLVLTISY